MRRNRIVKGMKIRTKKKLLARWRADTFFVKEKYLTTRKTDKKGIILGYVPGCGGDVWWVQHSKKIFAAYRFDEFMPI